MSPTDRKLISMSSAFELVSIASATPRIRVHLPRSPPSQWQLNFHNNRRLHAFVTFPSDASNAFITLRFDLDSTAVRLRFDVEWPLNQSRIVL